jgi:transcriptional regulator with XRE-family HTH domain
MAVEIEPFYLELGRRIHDRRKQKGLTQEKLGELLDPQVTRASIANIEMGAQRVLAHTLVQLAFHLGSSVPDLLPSVEIKANGRDERAVIFKELNKQLNLSPKQVEQLVKKLKRQTNVL